MKAEVLRRSWFLSTKKLIGAAPGKHVIIVYETLWHRGKVDLPSTARLTNTSVGLPECGFNK